MKNVVVDLGNYNVKYLAENRGCFSSKYNSKFNSNPELFERVEINGKVTYIGTGEYEREFNKVEKNYLPQLLYAISKACNESDINLCLLLPAIQMANKEKFINTLKGKLFNFSINGINRIININKISVLPEGFTSYFAISNRSEDSLVVDIGSRTINMASFVDGKLERAFTEKLGVLDLFSDIKERENSKGADYIEEDIERLIKTNRVYVESNMYMEFFKEILNRAKSQINIKNYKVYFVGGGALLLKDYIEANTPAIVHEDAVFANVIGAYKLCENVLKDEK